MIKKPDNIDRRINPELRKISGQQPFEFYLDLLDTNFSSDLADKCNIIYKINIINKK